VKNIWSDFVRPPQTVFVSYGYGGGG